MSNKPMKGRKGRKQGDKSVNLPEALHLKLHMMSIMRQKRLRTLLIEICQEWIDKENTKK